MRPSPAQEVALTTPECSRQPPCHQTCADTPELPGAPLSPQRGPSQFFPTASELPDPYGHGGGRAANGVVSPIRVRKQGSYRAPSPMHPTAAAGNRSMAYRDPGGRPVSPPMRGPRAMTASEYNAAHLERGWSYKGRSAANTQPTAVPALQRMVNNLMGAQQAVRNMGFASENAQKKESRRPPSVVTPKYDEVQLDGEEEGEGAEAAVGELVERAEGLVTLVPWVLDEFEKSGGNLRKDIADEAVDRLTQCVVEVKSHAYRHARTPTHLHTYTPTHLHTYTPTHLRMYHTHPNASNLFLPWTKSASRILRL
jgi:hypothetical protein